MIRRAAVAVRMQSGIGRGALVQPQGAVAGRDPLLMRSRFFRGPLRGDMTADTLLSITMPTDGSLT
ncbi:hypothetical protein GCM10010358_23980 [Streptomyces minutiscleroticus]|uniref:Uncharacterized protein n=1 Tax=Streptomyces minutiscleroticus TaxID=68238 RepID=A0A918KMI3_9ACTN|nr:hypothetical protein GCM10010358_23980 [Streptomyces minutiscleroticus]